MKQTLLGAFVVCLVSLLGSCGSSVTGMLPVAPASATFTSEASPAIGVANGVNTVFTVAFSPAQEPQVFENGLRLLLNGDYAREGQIITLVTPPATGDLILVDYYH
jgi:hypothetical protein